jgi:hypothetical protein
LSLHSCNESLVAGCHFALGIVADSPQAGELASLPAGYERKARRRACEPERPKKNYNIMVATICGVCDTLICSGAGYEVCKIDRAIIKNNKT